MKKDFKSLKNCKNVYIETATKPFRSRSGNLLLYMYSTLYSVTVTLVTVANNFVDDSKIIEMINKF